MKLRAKKFIFLCASLLLTTETMIAELPEEKPAQAAGGHAHGGMGGMGGMY